MHINLITRKLSLIPLSFTCFFMIACQSQNEQNATENRIRLITLSPHLAELVVSAGAIDNLVGVVSYSDFPDEVKSIKNIGDAFKIDYEAITALQPDYVLSWKGGTPIATVDKLKSLNINVLETQINQLSDIPATINLIANLTNTQDIADSNIETFKNTISELKQNSYNKQSLFIETFHQPIYTVSSDHWMSEAASVCGYENIFKQLPKVSVPVNIEAIIRKNPKTILNVSSQVDNQWLKWQNMYAVKNNNIHLIHPDYFTRPSMRILKGIKQLCEINRRH